MWCGYILEVKDSAVVGIKRVGLSVPFVIRSHTVARSHQFRCYDNDDDQEMLMGSLNLKPMREGQS